MKLIPDRPTHTKAAILSVIKSIVTLFILFRMSKCQKNKYFNVGSQPYKTANPEFQGSLSKLLADRERQDFAFSASSTEAKPLTLHKTKAPATSLKAADIDMILGKF